MKTIKIRVGGAGYEIVQSRFTNEEMGKLEKWIEKNGGDYETAFLYELENIFEERSAWFECNDLGHYYGASLSGKIYLEDEDDDWELEIGDDEEFDEKKLMLEVKEIMSPSSIYEVITGFSYNGKEISNEGPGDTTGKGLEVEID